MNQASSGRAPSAPKAKFWKSPMVRLGGCALILGLLFAFLPFGQIWAGIRRIPVSLSIGLLCFYMVLHLLGVVKWRMLINVAGAGLAFGQAVRCYYGGLFGNVFLPSLVGGDVVRGALAFPVSRSKAAVVMGSVIDRAQDVLGLGTVAAIGVLLLPQSLNPQSRRVFWTFGGALAVVGLVTLGILFTLPVRKFPFKVRRILAKLRHAARAMAGHWGTVLLCLVLGMILQVTQVGINYWLGLATGLKIGFGVWLFAWPLAKISALLPVTQGGIGVREVALVALLAPFGAASALTAAAGLVFEAITTIGGLIAGIIAFLVGRIAPPQPMPRSGVPALQREGGAVPAE